MQRGKLKDKLKWMPKFKILNKKLLGGQFREQTTTNVDHFDINHLRLIGRMITIPQWETINLKI